MGDDRQMTWDELCAEMVKQRKRAEKAEAERDELKGWNEKRIKHIERLEEEGMALQADREKLIGALEKIAKLLQVHPEQIIKAAWRYKVYAIVTAALA